MDMHLVCAKGWRTWRHRQDAVAATGISYSKADASREAQAVARHCNGASHLPLRPRQSWHRSRTSMAIMLKPGRHVRRQCL